MVSPVQVPSTVTTCCYLLLAAQASVAQTEAGLNHADSCTTKSLRPDDAGTVIGARCVLAAPHGQQMDVGVEGAPGNRHYPTTNQLMEAPPPSPHPA